MDLKLKLIFNDSSFVVRFLILAKEVKCSQVKLKEKSVNRLSSMAEILSLLLGLTMIYLMDVLL